MKFFLIFFLAISAFDAFSQKNKSDNINIIGWEDWMMSKEIAKSEFKFLSLLATKRQLKNIQSQVKLLANEYARYIDSVDVIEKANSVSLKIYSQDNTYICITDYAISFRKDSLILQKISFNKEMKSNIEDLGNFSNRKFELIYRSRKFNDSVFYSKNAYRLILDKDYDK